MLTLKDFFCLTKNDFSINPEEDFSLYAGRHELEEYLKAKIDEPFIRGRIPKMYLYGPYGGGKTHTLYHLKYYIENTHGDKVNTVMMNLGVLKRKSLFSDIFKRIMDKIGQSNIRKLVEKMATLNLDSDDLDQVFIDFFNDENIGKVFRKLSFRGAQEILSWKWLCGDKLSSNELALLEVPNNIIDVDKYTIILRKIGKLYNEIEGKFLIMLIDEFEHLNNIGDSDSVEDIKYAFRELLDKKNDSIGFIFAGTAEELDEIGDEIMLHPSILRRMDEAQGYVQIPRFEIIADVEIFIKEILNYLIDKKCAENKINKIEIDEDVSLDIYPFTKEGLELFINYISESPIRMIPSVICDNLNNVSVYATKNKYQFLSSLAVNNELY